MSQNIVRVLLVEDDEDHAFLIESAFDEHPQRWQLTHAKSIREARHCLAQSLPELVIVDLLLPDGLGTELLPNDRESMIVPFVLMTSNGNEAVAVEAIKGGALDYIVKSAFSLAEMPRTAERTLREWQLLVEKELAKDREKQLFSQLAHADRNNTMGEMAATLAHEINQPLAAIANYASTCVELIAENRLDRVGLVDALTQIDQQARRAGEIINRLKRFIAKVTPDPSPVDINELVQEVARLMTGAVQSADATLTLQLEPELPLVQVDSVQIQQVLVNLVRNALDAMEETQRDQRRITLRTHRNSEGVQIAVSDCGYGISREVADQMFQPHFSTKPDGLGLGLSISHRIIEAHGGRLWASTNASGGAMFQFILPKLHFGLRSRNVGMGK